MPPDERAREIYRGVGERVAAARLQRGWTQRQLSEATRGRLSRSAIANIESGRQRVAVHHLFDLADALEGRAAEFLPGRLELQEAASPAADQLRERIMRRGGGGLLSQRMNEDER